MPNVNINYQDMQAQATKLRSEQAEIEARLHSLRTDIQALVSSGFVTDSASGQFATTFEHFCQGATQSMQALDGMALYLDRAAAAFENVDSELARAIIG